MFCHTVTLVCDNPRCHVTETVENDDGSEDKLKLFADENGWKCRVNGDHLCSICKNDERFVISILEY